MGTEAFSKPGIVNQSLTAVSQVPSLISSACFHGVVHWPPWRDVP